MRLTLLIVLAVLACTTRGAQADPFTDVFERHDRHDRHSRADAEDKVERDRRHNLRFQMNEDNRLDSEGPDEIKPNYDDNDSDVERQRDNIRRPKPDQFAGDEFERSTFIDTDFSKRTFDDLIIQQSRIPTKPNLLLQSDFFKNKDSGDDGGKDGSYDKDSSDKDRANDDNVLFVDASRRMKDHTDFDLQTRLPRRSQLGDWVPDKPDKESNGGWEVCPDNGSPVPYRLNGHVEIERGFPWDPAD